MRRHRPDPRQGLFRWVWDDPADNRPDDDFDDDEPEPAPPPLRGRVRGRNAPRIALLWGVPVTLPKAPGRPVGRPAPPRPADDPPGGPAFPRGREGPGKPGPGASAETTRRKGLGNR
jgi:hypothetical protein